MREEYEPIMEIKKEPERKSFEDEHLGFFPAQHIIVTIACAESAKEAFMGESKSSSPIWVPPELKGEEVQQEEREISLVLQALIAMCDCASKHKNIVFEDTAKKMSFEDWAWGNAHVQALYTWIKQAEAVLAAAERHNKHKYARRLLEIAIGKK